VLFTAHERDEETTQVQVPDRIDHAGKRRQQPRKHEPARFGRKINAAVVRRTAADTDRFGHSFLSKSETP